MQKPHLSRHIVQVICWCFYGFGILVLIWGLLFATLMRDGLGPESTVSHGEEAWSRFITLYSSVAFIGLSFIFSGLIVSLLYRFTRKPSYYLGFTLLLLLLAGYTATVFFMGGWADNQPDMASIRKATDQYDAVINAIENYHIEQGQYPVSLSKLIPNYLNEFPGIYLEGGEMVGYSPTPSFGEPFTFYIYSHNTRQRFRKMWEEWELRYCRQSSCIYPSDFYMPNRIDENWVWIYRPEARPIFSRPFVRSGEPEPTPLPGWRHSVSALLLEDTNFPDGWVHGRSGSTDPIINHAYRSWWWEAKGSGQVEQDIWRSYTIESAEDYYAKLRQREFWVEGTPKSPEFFAEFEPVDAIDFQSQSADEFYLACGWRISGHCKIIARYRNYVVYMQLDRDIEYDEYVTHGLTDSQIEDVIRVMDTQFTDAMEGLQFPAVDVEKIKETN